MEDQKTFACAINCMDGRVQDAVKNYMQKNYQVDWVDQVTEPGPIKILAENAENQIIENIKKRIDVSVNHHGSKIIAIVGHHDCAGNPVDKETQKIQLKKSEEIVKSFGFNAEIVLLYVEGDWQTVEKI
jgi:carbonic anhydrase